MTEKDKKDQILTVLEMKSLVKQKVYDQTLYQKKKLKHETFLRFNKNFIQEPC